MEVSGQLHALVTLSLGKEPRYPLDRMLGGPYGLDTGHYEVEKNSYPARNQTLAIQPIALHSKFWKRWTNMSVYTHLVYIYFRMKTRLNTWQQITGNWQKLRQNRQGWRKHERTSSISTLIMNVQARMTNGSVRCGCPQQWCWVVKFKVGNMYELFFCLLLFCVPWELL
jgi:hypothetical protein